MKIPTFSRQSDPTTEDERPTVASSTTPVRERKDLPPPPPPRATGESTVRRPDETTTKDLRLPQQQAQPQVPAGPRPRSSMLATLGLIFGVLGALLVLSGPLLGYGLGLAGLALVFSLAGLFATRKRHIAGKTDALIGLALALGAIVVGILGLTGSLAWAGTDVPAASNLREWLDAQFGQRF